MKAAFRMNIIGSITRFPSSLRHTSLGLVRFAILLHKCMKSRRQPAALALAAARHKAQSPETPNKLKIMSNKIIGIVG